MKIVDIADEIFRELDQPKDVSVPQIAFWIRVNVGSLNNLINTEYAIDTTTLEISPDPGIQERAKKHTDAKNEKQKKEALSFYTVLGLSAGVIILL